MGLLSKAFLEIFSGMKDFRYVLYSSRIPLTPFPTASFENSSNLCLCKFDDGLSRSSNERCDLLLTFKRFDSVPIKFNLIKIIKLVKSVNVKMIMDHY